MVEQKIKETIVQISHIVIGSVKRDYFAVKLIFCYEQLKLDIPPGFVHNSEC